MEQPLIQRLRERQYLLLLIALLLLVVVYPVLHESGVSPAIYGALLTLVFVAAYWVVFAKRRYRLLAFVLGFLTLVGTWSGFAIPGEPSMVMPIAFHIVAILFILLAIVTILRSVFEQSEVTGDGVCGALCGYLLFGVTFGHIYCMLEMLMPGSFHGDARLAAQLSRDDHGHFVLTYFSFVTLTTVGYGDVSPVKGAARGLAVVEAVLGQFYIAVVIADLIGKRLSNLARRPLPPNGHTALPD